MPRKPDAANLENPIRKLRKQFGLTQDRFGEILGMNGDAIRNLENGRMKITAAIFRKIISTVGAEYSKKRKIWMVPLSRKRCDQSTLMAWRQSAQPSSLRKRSDWEALASRLAALLAYVKPKEYNALFMTLSELLDGCLEKHPSTEATEVFKKSKPQMTIRRISTKDPPVDEEEFSVAEELHLPTTVLPHAEIVEVARSYENFPKAAELLPKDADSEH